MRNVLIWAMLVFGWAAATLAQQAPSYASLSQLWRDLEQRNLNLQQLDQLQRSADLEVRARQAARLPRIAGSSSYSYVSQIARFEVPLPLPGGQPPEIEAGVKNQYDVSLLAQQPLFTGFRLRNLTRLARTRSEAVEMQKEILRNRLRLQAGQLYYQIQLNRMQKAVLESGLERLRLQLETVRNFFLAEQATAFDTLEVFNRSLQLHNQGRRLIRLEQILLSRLQHLLNLPEPVDISAPPPAPPNFAPRTLDDCRNEALQHRPELRNLQWQKRAQELQVRIAQSAFFPQIAAVVGFHYAKPGVNFFANRWMTYYTVGLQMQWSLWNWQQDRYRVQQAQAEVQRLTLEEQAQVQQVLQEVEEAFRNRQNALEQIDLQERLVALERERYRQVQQRFEQGLSSQINLRQAETRLTEAELLLQRNYIEAYQADLQLQYATGRFELHPQTQGEK